MKLPHVVLVRPVIASEKLAMRIVVFCAGGGNISLFALLRLFAAANVKYTKLARVNVKSATQCNIHLQDIFGIFSASTA